VDMGILYASDMHMHAHVVHVDKWGIEVTDVHAVCMHMAPLSLATCTHLPSGPPSLTSACNCSYTCRDI
jgi:hypothetical protein